MNILFETILCVLTLAKTLK